MEQTQIMREAILDEKPDLEEARKTCDKAFKENLSAISKPSPESTLLAWAA